MPTRQWSRITARFAAVTGLQGVQPDVATYNVLLQACTSPNHLPRPPPPSTAFDAVATPHVPLQACERQNKLDIIAQLIEQMPTLGVEPSIVNYNTAVRALCRGGDLARATRGTRVGRPLRRRRTKRRSSRFPSVQQ